MTAALLIAGTLVLCAIIQLIRIGCRAIIQIADDLNRDQRNEYRVQPDALPPEAKPQSRQCPPWVNRANGRATR